MTAYLYLIFPVILTAFSSLVFCLYFYRKNQKLRRHQKELEAEISDKREIISVAAHEIGGPLTNIKGTLSLVAKDPGFTGPSQKFIERALVSVEELIDLIDSLLTVSRFERGKIVLNKGLFDIKEICLEVVNQLRPLAAKENIVLEYQNPKEEIGPILADGQRLREVLLNLVGNSIKYAGQGSVLISASVDPGSWLVVSVSDNGPGINQADLKHLFNRFVRLPSASSLASNGGHSGVGLGLYISRLIVEAHGGRIWAESKLGQGTTFYFSLPLLWKRSAS